MEEVPHRCSGFRVLERKKKKKKKIGLGFREREREWVKE